MITREQTKELAAKYKISDYVVLREYLQLLFLKELYTNNFSKNIYFKGGTSIRLIHGGKRFSEDLDFTVQIKEGEFTKIIQEFFKRLEDNYPVRFKERKTITGKTYLMTAQLNISDNPVFIKLDFSMRENVLEPEEKIIQTEYPIVMQNFIYCISKDELFAEKLRAVMKRKKHRDLYDLWILLELGAEINNELVTKKLAYYGEKFDPSALIERLDKFSVEEFEKDLRPFLPINERSELKKLFIYVRQYLKERFS